MTADDGDRTENGSGASDGIDPADAFAALGDPLWVTDEAGRTHDGDGIRPEEYHASGKPIVAPADETTVHDRVFIREGQRVSPQNE